MIEEPALETHGSLIQVKHYFKTGEHLPSPGIPQRVRTAKDTWKWPSPGMEITLGLFETRTSLHQLF